MNERQEKRIRLLADLVGSIKAPYKANAIETINELRGKSFSTQYVCLQCNCTFKTWDIVPFNQKEVCPLCGIAKDVGQYKEEVND